jgi:hypothetical protein
MGDLSAMGNRFHFLFLWTQFVCVSKERESELAQDLSAAAPSSAHQPLRALSKTQHQGCHYLAATRCCFPTIDTAKLAPTFLVRATLRANH